MEANLLPSPPQDGGGQLVDYVLAFLRCLQVHPDASYRMTIDSPEEMV